MQVILRKLLFLFFLIAVEIQFLIPLSAFAQTSSTSAQNTLPTASIAAIPLSPNPSTPPVDIVTRSQTSAFIKTSPVVQQLAKKFYRSDEDVSVSIANPQDDSFSVEVLDSKGAKADVATEEIKSTDSVLFAVAPRSQFRPGKYTLVVKDAASKSSEQNFQWGVLAINPDRSIYLPGQTADLAMAVLDELGNMVCDASLDLKITHASANTNDELTTKNGKITVNPQCRSHNFSLHPDYEAHYQVGSPGTYNLDLTAQTKNGSYSITDTLMVKQSVPFDVQRVSATRIYPPNAYPVQFNITANQDFTGKVTETVPDSFTITSASNSADVKSYDDMRTMYLNRTLDPAAKLASLQPQTTLPLQSSGSAVLGASTSALVLPFEGNYPITEGFGAEQTDPSLRAFYQQYGLAGHDGVDFGLPIGTPVHAVDEGNVLLAGNGDYGVTIVIQHSWGKSYYGHLSQVLVGTLTHVTKGQEIGISGNSGEATGPHLHFGMKPEKPDMKNGYYGKIDPLPYLGIAEPIPPEQTATDSAILAIPITASGSAVLGASTSAEVLSPPSLVTDRTEGASNSAAFTHQMRSEILDTPTTANAEKVKVITWNIAIKKGQKISLGYKLKVPDISPQFYLLGPLRFSASASNTPVFQETRQWQLAADAVGVAWYDYNWQYRKQITINHTKVDPDNTASTVTFMESGTDATQDFSFYDNVQGGTYSSDTTFAHTGPRSIKFNTSSPAALADRETPAGSLNGSAGRISYYVRFANLLNDDMIQCYSGATFVATCLGMNSSHKLYGPGLTGGSTTLTTGQWYHIVVAYSITSTTVNTFKIYLDGNLERTDTNVTIFATNPDRMRFGILGTGSGANAVINVDDIYIDNGTTLDDPGPIQVTNKRPFANGTSNQFTTQIGSGGSGYGSGHAPQVNEQPLNNANGWSISTTTKQTEEYNLESINQGDVDLTGTQLVSNMGWITADNSTASNAPVSHIIVNGVATAVTMTTSPALYTKIAKSTTYPVGTGTDIGMDGQYTTTAGTWRLFEAGMLIAYYSSGSLSNFPVLVNLSSDTSLSANAQSSGNDILFTDSTGQTKLNHQIENYNSSTGALVAWVNVPTLSASTDTILYMYYGNAAATNQQNATGAWNSNFIGVWHLSETSGQHQDSTTNANNATTTQVTGEGTAAGQISGGDQFNNTVPDYVNIPSNSGLITTPVTISAWINLSQLSSNRGSTETFVGKDNTYSLETQTTDKACFNWTNSVGTGYGVCGNTTLTTGTWYSVVGEYSGSGTVHIFVNGVDDSNSPATPTGTVANNTNSLHLSTNNTTFALKGYEDEVHFSNTGLSAGWIATEYNDQSSPSSFYTLGAVETKLFAPTLDQLMKHGAWMCPQTPVQAFPNATSGCTTPGKQPFVF